MKAYAKVYRCTILVLKRIPSKNLFEVEEVNSVQISTRLILISRMHEFIQVHWPQNPTEHPDLPVYLMHHGLVDGEYGYDRLEPVKGSEKELEQRIRGTVLPHCLLHNIDLSDSGEEGAPRSVSDSGEVAPRSEKARTSKKGRGLKGSRELAGLFNSSGSNEGKKDI